MGLFGKKKEEAVACSCNGNCNTERMAQGKSVKAGEITIKVLGSGCAKCNQLEAATREALVEMGMSTEIEHITDFSQIATYGVMTTPALVVNDKVVSYGKVLKKMKLLHFYKKTYRFLQAQIKVKQQLS